MNKPSLLQRVANKARRTVDPPYVAPVAPEDGSSVTWLFDQADRMKPRLTEIKARRTDVLWYPYGSLQNFTLLKDHFLGEGRRIFDGLDHGMRVLDIGAADGDTAFVFESLGASVTVLDNGPTNFNGCAGVKALTAELGSSVQLIEQDIDFQPEIPGRYDLAIFLGILYHLRNPTRALDALARVSDRMLLSTVTFSRLPDGTPVEDVSLGYFWDTVERNNDATNYWALTPAALRRLLKRSGWEIVEEFRVGEVPADPVFKDERMFCYCRRLTG